jgi:hypothetical protein
MTFSVCQPFRFLNVGIRTDARHDAAAEARENARGHVENRPSRVRVPLPGGIHDVLARPAVVQLEDRVPGRTQLSLVPEIGENDTAVPVAGPVRPRPPVLPGPEERRRRIDEVEAPEAREDVRPERVERRVAAPAHGARETFDGVMRPRKATASVAASRGRDRNRAVPALQRCRRSRFTRAGL